MNKLRAASMWGRRKAGEILDGMRTRRGIIRTRLRRGFHMKVSIAGFKRLKRLCHLEEMTAHNRLALSLELLRSKGLLPELEAREAYRSSDLHRKQVAESEVRCRSVMRPELLQGQARRFGSIRNIRRLGRTLSPQRRKGTQLQPRSP